MANIIGKAERKHSAIRRDLTVGQQIALDKAKAAAVAATHLYEWLVNESAIWARKEAKRKGKK